MLTQSRVVYAPLRIGRRDGGPVTGQVDTVALVMEEELADTDLVIALAAVIPACARFASGTQARKSWIVFSDIGPPPGR